MNEACNNRSVTGSALLTTAPIENINILDKEDYQTQHLIAKYMADRKRFYTLSLFSFLSCVQCLSWFTFSTVPGTLKLRAT